MTFSDAQHEQYPPQDEATLLLDFSAELLARRKFDATGHAGKSFEDWIGTDPDTRDERMEKFRAHAENLAAMRMLSWPATETPGIVWAVEGPSRCGGPGWEPGADWAQPYNFNAKRAIELFRLCRATGQPCRISWAFTGRRRISIA